MYAVSRVEYLSLDNCLMYSSLQSYSAVTKQSMNFAGEWMRIEKSASNEVTQTKNGKYFVFSGLTTWYWIALGVFSHGKHDFSYSQHF